MSVISAGAEVPEFKLLTAEGEPFTRADLLGRTSLLIFYPFAFSGGCTNQLTTYEAALDEFHARGLSLYAISTDARQSQAAFKEKVGSSIDQLSDFEPKGAAAEAFGARHSGGMTTRAVVIVGSDGLVRWSEEKTNLFEFPTPAEILAALDAS